MGRTTASGRAVATLISLMLAGCFSLRKVVVRRGEGDFIRFSSFLLYANGVRRLEFSVARPEETSPMRPDNHLSGEASNLAAFPLPMPDLPRPGQKVRWRSLRHARAIGWLDAYGHGPFEVVAVVDKSHLGISVAVVVRTNLGEREINVVWLTAEGPGSASI
jgi:hypothetical protein